MNSVGLYVESSGGGSAEEGVGEGAVTKQSVWVSSLYCGLIGYHKIPRAERTNP